MKRRFHLRLSTAVGAIVVLSIGTATIVRFGTIGLVFLLAGGSLACGIAGAVRRRLGLAVAGLFCFVAILLGTPILTVAAWDGYKTVPLKFIVVDASSKRPIGGADAEVRESDAVQPVRPRPGEARVSGATGPDGSVILAWDCQAGGREGPLEHSGSVSFDPREWVEASAPGYATQLIRLQSLTGTSRDISDPVPPPMRIFLVPIGPTK